MDINKVNIQFVDEFRTYMVNERKLAGDSAYKYFGLLGTILKTAKKYENSIIILMMKNQIFQKN